MNCALEVRLCLQVCFSFSFLLVIYFCFLFVVIFIHSSSVLTHLLWFPLNSDGRMELDLCAETRYYYIRLFLGSPEILKQTYITLYCKMEIGEGKKLYSISGLVSIFCRKWMFAPDKDQRMLAKYLQLTQNCFMAFREDWPQLSLIGAAQQFCCVYKLWLLVL